MPADIKSGFDLERFEKVRDLRVKLISCAGDANRNGNLPTIKSKVTMAKFAVVTLNPLSCASIKNIYEWTS